jgi:hypothetical protein
MVERSVAHQRPQHINYSSAFRGVPAWPARCPVSLLLTARLCRSGDGRRPGGRLSSTPHPRRVGATHIAPRLGAGPRSWCGHAHAHGLLPRGGGRRDAIMACALRVGVRGEARWNRCCLKQFKFRLKKLRISVDSGLLIRYSTISIFSKQQQEICRNFY